MFWNEVIFKILKKPSPAQKKIMPHMKTKLIFTLKNILAFIWGSSFFWARDGFFSLEKDFIPTLMHTTVTLVRRGGRSKSLGGQLLLGCLFKILFPFLYLPLPAPLISQGRCFLGFGLFLVKKNQNMVDLQVRTLSKETRYLGPSRLNWPSRL